VLWSAHLSGRDPDVWNDPLRFDPDRFLDMTKDQQAAADAAWVPFGGGRRNCIGFALAQMELTLLIARLAQRLDVTPPATGKPGPIGMVVNRPRGGVPFHVTRRT
jgi:cytochrome P450